MAQATPGAKFKLGVGEDRCTSEMPFRLGAHLRLCMPNDLAGQRGKMLSVRVLRTIGLLERSENDCCREESFVRDEVLPIQHWND